MHTGTKGFLCWKNTSHLSFTERTWGNSLLLWHSRKDTSWLNLVIDSFESDAFTPVCPFPIECGTHERFINPFLWTPFIEQNEHCCNYVLSTHSLLIWQLETPFILPVPMQQLAIHLLNASAHHEREGQIFLSCPQQGGSHLCVMRYFIKPAERDCNFHPTQEVTRHSSDPNLQKSNQQSKFWT